MGTRILGKAPWLTCLSMAAAAPSSSCDETGNAPVASGEPTPAELALAIAGACPMADPGDDVARRSCAEGLRDSAPLTAVLGTEVSWGGRQGDEGSLNPVVHRTTRFNARVWRMMYLSQFMFTGAHTVESDGSFTAVHLTATFRRDLDIGQYPYPLWHSASKWASHLDATEVILVLRNGQLVAGYRAGNDTTQPRVERTWDGRWTWDDGAGLEPRVALFTYLLEPNNPYLGELNDAYRALETRFRDETCADCHSPENKEKMSPLALLTYPNQALGERHRLIDVLEDNAMPPDEGIAEAHRAELLTLALEFARVGDRALEFEGEPIE